MQALVRIALDGGAGGRVVLERMKRAEVVPNQVADRGLVVHVRDFAERRLTGFTMCPIEQGHALQAVDVQRACLPLPELRYVAQHRVPAHHEGHRLAPARREKVSRAQRHGTRILVAGQLEVGNAGQQKQEAEIVVVPGRILQHTAEIRAPGAGVVLETLVPGQRMCKPQLAGPEARNPFVVGAELVGEGALDAHPGIAQAELRHQGLDLGEGPRQRVGK